MKKLLLLFAVLIPTIYTGCNTPAPKSKEKPNFVWLISEDNSKHYLRLFDEHGMPTPVIEMLAQNGITFTRAFSNAPVCSVARTTLETGCYGPRIGTQFHRKSQPVPLPEGLKMFPTYLRDAGYYTTNKQKTDYNAIPNEGVWDESSKNAHWRNRKAGQPFFHKESFADSHESRLHFSEEDMANYSPSLNPDSVFVNPRHPNTPLFRYTNAFYRDKMLVVDNWVKERIQQLEADGLLESTFVFYFGDHGGVLPGSKGYLYETGLHIPLVVRVPEKFRHLVPFKNGEKTDGFVSFVDFGPTLLALAGLEVPEGMDGKPFLGEKIKKEHIETRDITYGYADRFDEKYDLVRTIRKGRYKYMRSFQPFNPDALHNFYRYKCLAYKEWRDMYNRGELNETQALFFEPRAPEELYDIENDPYETRNLAGDPAYGNVLVELRNLLIDWVKGMPDLSFYPENELRKSAFENPVVFGQTQKHAIEELIDIANLSLLPYSQARAGIKAALESGHSWKEYWGLITCTTFGKQAAECYPLAQSLLNDNQLMVRTRAAEFLALNGQLDPNEVLTAALRQCTDEIEATLMLNSVVLLKDSPFKYTFDLTENMFSENVAKGDWVQRRMEYLLGKE